MKEFTDPIKLFEHTWLKAEMDRKRQLLKVTGGHPSFAKTKTVKEMVSRGGGMSAKALLDLHRKYLKKKGGRVTISDW